MTAEPLLDVPLERTRLESKAGQQHRASPKRVNAHAISDLTLKNDHSVWRVNLDVRRGLEPHVSQSHHNRRRHLRRVEVEATEPSVLTLSLPLELRVAL